jgi:hypothetical protein
MKNSNLISENSIIDGLVDHQRSIFMHAQQDP